MVFIHNILWLSGYSSNHKLTTLVSSKVFVVYDDNFNDYFE